MPKNEPPEISARDLLIDISIEIVIAFGRAAILLRRYVIRAVREGSTRR